MATSGKHRTTPGRAPVAPAPVRTSVPSSVLATYDAPPDAHLGCGCSADVAEDLVRGGGISRRVVLQGAGALGLAGAASAVGLGALSGTRVAFAAPGDTTGDALIVLSLRGGADGLSMVPPFGDPDYAKARPGIAVPQGTALPLDSYFGLHPALSALMPFWKASQLGVVHATASIDPTRSHFDAVASMERGTPGTGGLASGWINRMLATAAPTSPLQAIQLGDRLPIELQGSFPALTFQNISEVGLRGDDNLKDKKRAALAAMYAGLDHPLASTISSTVKALETIASLQTKQYQPTAGVTYPKQYMGDRFKEIARLIKADVGMQVAAFDDGGWDMHTNLGKPDTGQMHDRLKEVGDALGAFASDLGPLLSKVVVVVLSEFGRSITENGNGGVDHGRGQAMLMLGGGVNGGKVYGKWPTLAPAARDQGDVAMTSDFRDVVGEIAQKRLGIGSLTPVFPNLKPAPLGVAKARA